MIPLGKALFFFLSHIKNKNNVETLFFCKSIFSSSFLRKIPFIILGFHWNLIFCCYHLLAINNFSWYGLILNKRCFSKIFSPSQSIIKQKTHLNRELSFNHEKDFLDFSHFSHKFCAIFALDFFSLKYSFLSCRDFGISLTFATIILFRTRKDWSYCFDVQFYSESCFTCKIQTKSMRSDQKWKKREKNERDERARVLHSHLQR